MKSIYISLLLAGTVAAGGSKGLAAETNINPALLYYQAFLLAPDPMPEADMDYLYSAEGRSHKLPDRFGPLAAGYDNQFRMVRDAARSQAPCDWGLDMSAGPATLLPHLARSKAVVQAARLRVKWDLQNDRQAEAREDLLGAFALGRNVARDGTLISVLVQIAIEAITCNTVAENFGQFSPESLQQLLAGLDSAPARRTVAESMRTEKQSFVEWFVRQVQELQRANPGDDAKVMASIRKLFNGMQGPVEGQTSTAEPDPWAQVEQAAGGTSAGVLRLLAEEEQICDRVAVIAALPPKDYDSQAKQFRAELEKSTNPFVTLALPAFEKARQREFRILVWLEMVRAATEYKVHGTAGYRAVTDPWGDGPFEFKRFVFQGVDRGFQLTSAFEGSGYRESLIFVEKPGPAFRVDGPHVGEAIAK